MLKNQHRICSSFQKKNRELTTLTYSSWCANAVGTKATKYGLKLGQNCTDVMIGFAPKTLTSTISNYTSCGWYFYTNGGTLYSQAGDSSRSYGSSDYNPGTCYSFELNVKKRNYDLLQICNFIRISIYHY